MELDAITFASEFHNRVNLAALSADSHVGIVSLGDLRSIAENMATRLATVLHTVAMVRHELAVHDSVIDRHPRKFLGWTILQSVR
jgi:hypothetical protein